MDQGFAQTGWHEPDFSPALSPLDGRYRSAAGPLTNWLSEDALNRARLYVEINWIVFLTRNQVIKGIAPLTDAQELYLRDLPGNFNVSRRERLAQFEQETRHDVKAVEYLVREHLENSNQPELLKLLELTHFLCTSEDINNLSYALCIKEALAQVWVPAAQQLVDDLASLSANSADAAMLARTHGQPATPTTMGKEMAVFVARLQNQIDHIKAAPIVGKLNGATGTYSAHVAVLPDADWQALSKSFVESLGLTWNPITTQIEPHDWQANLYSHVEHFNRIAHNFATDIWMYISLGYFKQRSEGSTGSSTMPHKINPIRFENAEANLEMSNAVLGALAANLTTTRMQRDLTDSSLQRNIGIGFGYSLVAIENLKSGLKNLALNEELLAEDLAKHPEVLSEAVQQALRLAALTTEPTEGAQAQEPYALLKNLTRGKEVSIQDIRAVIESANLPEPLRSKLLTMEPKDYIGIAPVIARETVD